MPRYGDNIYLRKDGRYEGRCIKGRKANGKIIYHSVYAKKRADCKKKLLQAKILYLQNDLDCKIYGTGTVSEFMDYWLYDIVEPIVKESTFSNYFHYNEKWIIPFLGKKKISRLEEEHIQQFINHLTKQELSAGSVQNVYRTLYGALKKAQIYGYIRNNPCIQVILPENTQKTAQTLSLTEQKKLEKVARSSPKGLPVLLALYTGLRIGEVCALTWNDVDFIKGTLSVSKTRQRIQRPKSKRKQSKTHVATGSAKSSSSVRTIPLPLFILELLQQYKGQATGEYIITHNGCPLEPRTLQYHFKRLLQLANIKAVNFHALRHSFATRCMEQCIDVKTISELLGHSSAKITLDLYGHSRFEQKQVAMNYLHQLYLDS